MQKFSATLLRCTILIVVACAGTAAGARDRSSMRPCVESHITAGYASSVRRALKAGKDVWGNELLRSRAGPTYTGVTGRLKPLLLAAGRGGRRLTDSGVYYLPFARPSQFGAQTVALVVADGSEILANRTSGPKLTISVGNRAQERYGSCLSRLSTPQLSGGYLPILETRYRDAHGVRYAQESFAGRIPETSSLVSFVRLTVDASASSHVVKVRFAPSARNLTLSEDGRSLTHGRNAYLYVGDGAEFDGTAVTYTVPPGTRASVYVAWLVDPGPSKPFIPDEEGYLRARQSVVDFWTETLAGGATYEVPEKRVQDAERSLLIQDLSLAWRYSVGNGYHTKLSTPEGIDAAGVLGEYGFPAINKAILDVSFWRKLTWTTNWKMGEQLLGSARYYALFHDRPYLAVHTPRLAAYVAHLRRQVVAGTLSLLRRERYSEDVNARVFGLHSQAVAWAGLRAMGSVWARTGNPLLAARARAVAARLGAGLSRAARKSTKKVGDGSLFVPIRLVDGERPYRALTRSRPGSYWNLVMPYALASGIFPPGSARADGVLRYLLAHGSRILGLVRAGAFTLYGKPHFPDSGTDQVYGLNVARFLADNDRPDQLVLSLYGQLAAGMTAGTFVSGEAATIAPVRGEYFREMFLPPNSASNAAFLETLRVMLVHESEGRGGAAGGLELAFATPRAWLRPGRQIAVTDAPTSFGALSYSLAATKGVVEGSLDVPTSAALRTLKLRLRLPVGERLTSVVLDGHPYHRFDPATGTIDLSGRAGSLSLEARYAEAR
jgi:hypothetical protein